MKICLAQIKSIKGDLTQNIPIHLDGIQRAIEWGTDLIIFPELSLTGYEPSLAKELAKDLEDSIFNVFQEKADKNNISIVVGMPIKRKGGIVIGMLIFQPLVPRMLYAKQILHADELPFFEAGDNQVFIDVKEYKIAFGICYEALQRKHFLTAKQANATLYIASVSKPEKAMVKAYDHFVSISKEFSIPVLMVNNVGFSDDFMAIGKSAAWNFNGEMIGQLPSSHAALLLADLKRNIAEIDDFSDQHPVIQLAKSSDLTELVQVFKDAKNHLDQQHIFQWTNTYPSKKIIEKDLNDKTLFVLKKGFYVIGAVTLNEFQDAEYQAIDWEFGGEKVLVIHRLVVDPVFQRNGYAKKIMDFAERFAKENQYNSIRLDTYTHNKISFEFYKKRDYVLCGEVFFPGRPLPFYCMEKKIS